MFRQTQNSLQVTACLFWGAVQKNCEGVPKYLHRPQCVSKTCDLSLLYQQKIAIWLLHMPVSTLRPPSSPLLLSPSPDAVMATSSQQALLRVCGAPAPGGRADSFHQQPPLIKHNGTEAVGESHSVTQSCHMTGRGTTGSVILLPLGCWDTWVGYWAGQRHSGVHREDPALSVLPDSGQEGRPAYTEVHSQSSSWKIRLCADFLSYSPCLPLSSRVSPLLSWLLCYSLFPFVTQTQVQVQVQVHILKHTAREERSALIHNDEASNSRNSQTHQRQGEKRIQTDAAEILSSLLQPGADITHNATQASTVQFKDG